MKRILSFALATLLVLTASVLLTACKKEDAGNWRTDVKATALMDTVTAAAPSADGYAAVSDSFISASTWGTDYRLLLDSIGESAICISNKSDMNIDEIGVFRVKDGADVDKVADIARDYLTAQKLRYKDLLASYNPDELPKAENGEVLVCGQYVLYTLLDDTTTDKVQKAFRDALIPEAA